MRTISPAVIIAPARSTQFAVTLSAGVLGEAASQHACRYSSRSLSKYTSHLTASARNLAAAMIPVQHNAFRVESDAAKCAEVAAAPPSPTSSNVKKRLLRLEAYHAPAAKPRYRRRAYSNLGVDFSPPTLRARRPPERI